MNKKVFTTKTRRARSRRKSEIFVRGSQVVRHPVDPYARRTDSKYQTNRHTGLLEVIDALHLLRIVPARLDRSLTLFLSACFACIAFLHPR